MSNSPLIRNYFVDESGDGTLYTSEGRVIIGSEGCSNFFILGILDIPEPDTLKSDLNDLRKQLMADPYFNKVPSMQPEQDRFGGIRSANEDALLDTAQGDRFEGGNTAGDYIVVCVGNGGYKRLILKPGSFNQLHVDLADTGPYVDSQRHR